jgi:hypothetical protein
MSSMAIFAFGFILGGFTAMLIMGLLFLFREKTATSKYQGFVSEPEQGVTNPKIFPKVRVLNGSKAPSFLPREGGHC